MLNTTAVITSASASKYLLPEKNFPFHSSSFLQLFSPLIKFSIGKIRLQQSQLIIPSLLVHYSLLNPITSKFRTSLRPAQRIIAIMIVAGLIFSAAAVFLGLFIKLPQGGGGTVNNLMVMSLFLPSQPYSPPSPPQKAVFDVDADIFGIRKVYPHQFSMTCNITQDPLPQCYTKPRHAVPKNSKFAIPIFSLLRSSLR